MSTRPKDAAPIPLPQDLECRISTLLLASNLVHTENETYLAYTHEVDVKALNGASRSTRDVERVSNERLATVRRLYGPIRGIGGPTRTSPNQRYYIIGAFILLSTVLLAYALESSAVFQVEAQLWWASYGGYFEGLIILLALLLLFIFFRRSRRSRPNQGGR